MGRSANESLLSVEATAANDMYSTPELLRTKFFVLN